MKLATGQVASALKSSGQYGGLLIHGSDWGLVRDQALAAIQAVVGSQADPFRLTSLPREEHGRLRAEAGSMALGGGRRVIHVRDGGDALVATLEKLAVRPTDTLIVLEAGDLTTRSKLRMFAERHTSWVAISCPIGNASQVAADIRAVLARAGSTATPDAVAFLTQELAGDTVTRHGELDKLLLYAGEASIDIEMARLCCSLSMEASLGAAIAAALSGQPDLCDALLAGLAQESVSGAGLLAVLSMQVQRLLKVRLLIDGGQSAEEACRVLTPPLYPRQASAFLRDVQRWRAAALEALGRAIREADRACKRAASPDFAIASRLLATVANRQPARR